MLNAVVKTKGSIDHLKQPRAPEDIAICDICVTFDRCDGVIVFQARHEKIALDFAGACASPAPAFLLSTS